MQGLDAGRFAQKYNFWQGEYVSRNNELIAFQEQLAKRRESLIKIHGATSCEVSVFMNDSINEMVIKCGYRGKQHDSTNIIECLTSGGDIITPEAIYSDGPVKIKNGYKYDSLPEIKHSNYGESLIDVTIDISKDIDSIVFDVKNLVLTLRAIQSGEISTNSAFIERFRGLNNQKFFADKQSSILGGYTPLSDHVRAVGLWLWDRVKELGNQRGAVKQAIADLHKTDFVPRPVSWTQVFLTPPSPAPLDPSSAV